MEQSRVTQLEQPLGGHLFKIMTVMTYPRERATLLHVGAQVA